MVKPFCRESLRAQLFDQIESACELFETDRRQNVEGVQLPGALERKYPHAGKEREGTNRFFHPRCYQLIQASGLFAATISIPTIFKGT